MANNYKFNNNVKTNAKMDELRAIEKSPELTEYIIRTKIKDVHKTAIILGIIAAIMAFAGGMFVGLNINKISTPQNVVEVRVDSAQNTPNAKPEGK